MIDYKKSLRCQTQKGLVCQVAKRNLKLEQVLTKASIKQTQKTLKPLEIHHCVSSCFFPPVNKAEQLAAIMANVPPCLVHPPAGEDSGLEQRHKPAQLPVKAGPRMETSKSAVAKHQLEV